MRRGVLFIVLILVAGLTMFSYGAGVPQIINYNGTLTDTLGNPVPDGQYDVEFNIYNVPTGGTALWTETWNVSTTKVVVTKGNFNAILGAHTTIPASFFSDNTVTYLGVKVGTDSEMLPRQRITSVGYAFTAGYAHNSGGGIPQGGIIMWSGAIVDIPADWALCDGTNGTPDLRDMFVVGAGGGYAVGATGGEVSHVLNTSEMPEHNHSGASGAGGGHGHSISDPGHYHGITSDNETDTPWPYGATGNNTDGTVNTNSATTGITVNGVGDHTHSVISQGSGAAHENRPPYYALAFIMKL